MDAVGARAVPGHSDEQRTVVAEIGGPPLLRSRHHLLDVLFHGIEIERPELFCVTERLAHGVARRVIRVEDSQVQLIGPPVAVRPTALRLGREWALCFVFHVDVDLYCGRVAGRKTLATKSRA